MMMMMIMMMIYILIYLFNDGLNRFINGYIGLEIFSIIPYEVAADGFVSCFLKTYFTIIMSAAI